MSALDTGSDGRGDASRPEGQRTPRLDSLTGMRWWAAFFVFGYHMLVFAPLPAAPAAFLDEGFYGVTFFFVLSGFVLTWSWSPKVRQSTFYWRRFARIYPAHFVALLIAIPIFYSFSPNPDHTWVKPVSLGILALSFVLLQGWFSAPNILFSGNPAAWTLTCEMFFYFLHPYLHRVLRRVTLRGSLLFVAVVLVIAFGYRTLAGVAPGEWYTSLPLPLVRTSEFAIGMGLAGALRAGWRPRIPVSAAGLSIVAVVAAVVLVPHYAPGSGAANIIGLYAEELVTVACSLTILAGASAALRGRRSILATRPFVKLGEWSFCFYLVHATIMYAVLAWLGPRPVGWINLLWYAALLAVAILAAALLHQCVERPVEKRLRAWKNRRDLVRTTTARAETV